MSRATGIVNVQPTPTEQHPAHIDYVVPSPEHVAEEIANHLSKSWDTDGSVDTITVTVAGSFPAAVLAFRRTNGEFILPFNDVDVFLSEGSPVRLTDEARTFRSPTLPNEPINFSFHDVVDLTNILLHFDINAVTVGYEIAIRFASRSPSGFAECRITQWAYHREWFESFLLSRTLQIHALGACFSKADSLVRLLYKAQQLQLPFHFPSGREIRTAFGHPHEGEDEDAAEEENGVTACYLSQSNSVKLLMMDSTYRRHLLRWFRLDGVDDVPHNTLPVLRLLPVVRDGTDEWLFQLQCSRFLFDKIRVTTNNRTYYEGNDGSVDIADVD